MTKRNREMPTKEQIAERAYEIYVERGAADGLDVDDWIRAEKQLYDHYFTDVDKTEQQERTERQTTSAAPPPAANPREEVSHEVRSSSGAGGRDVGK